MSEKWKRDQQHKLLLVVLSCIYIFVVLGFAALSCRIVSSDTKRELGNKAMILAIDIAERLEMNSGEYERLLSLDFNQLLEDPANQDFEKKARAVMKYTDIKYIYLEAPLTNKQLKYQVEADEVSIYGKPQGTPLKVVYVLDAVINDQTRWDDTDGQWYTDKDRYTTMSDKFEAAYKSRHPTSFLNVDEWGTYITGYAPYFDDEGNYRGLIGVDLFLDAYVVYLQKNLLIIAGFVITLLAIGFFTLFLTIRIKKVEDLVEEKSMLSDIDGLTLLLNRRHFLELMENRWKQSQRDKKPIALLIIDVDYFKEYNDNYGHLAGDEVLRRIARVLKGNVRQSYDFVGRYGGDEFVVLLNNTDSKTAQRVAECLAEKIDLLQIEHQYSPIHNRETVTIGVASMVASPELSLEELFRRADNALYYGKDLGKNQIQVWDESMPDKSPHQLSNITS